MKEEVLRIYVKLEDTITIHGNRERVNMIRFSGYAKSKYFCGEVLPGGADLQRGPIEGSMKLSARYILEGTDFEGKSCRIYIENNGAADENGVIVTKPTIVTDSKALARMETADMTGAISSENNMVVIHIYWSV